MPEQQEIDKNDPMFILWDEYKASAEYKNSFKWAGQERHRDGSMWAAFVQGYVAAQKPRG